MAATNPNLMKPTKPILIIAAAAFTFCSNPAPNSDASAEQPKEPSESMKKTTEAEPAVEFSFAFVGCNRVQRGDQQNPDATNTSSANLGALKRIFGDVTAQERKPELFFFLGDLVYAESTTELLNSQLDAWVKQYQDPSFSTMATSSIELVAVPGNHEMLSWADHNVEGHDEWPLKGATKLWMKYMAPYMPTDREKVTGADAEVNQMTFSFTRKNVGFIVMNTDTYNPPTKENPWGLEGQIPTQWVLDKIKQYQTDAAIDHVFVLGHKPYYVNATSGSGLDPQPQTGHSGLPEGPTLWPAMTEAQTVAMLSAHVHDYQRMQPGNKGPYQVIAGNGGSDGAATFFGYSTINILSNGDVQLVSRGYDVGSPYYQDVPDNKFSVRDQTILTWSANANPFGGN